MPDSTDIFNRLIQPERGELSPEHARYILSLSFSDAEKARAEELSYKAQDATLSPDERQELETLLALNSMLIVLKAKARNSLKQRPSAA